LARILHEVNVRGLMRDEHYGFRPRHSTSLHLDRLFWKNNQDLWRKEANRRAMRTPTPSPPGHTRRPGCLGLWESLSLCGQPIGSISAGRRSVGPGSHLDIRRGDASVLIRACKWTQTDDPTEVQDATRGLKVGKAPGPHSIPNRTLKHLPLRAASLLVVLFNAILRTQYFPGRPVTVVVLSTRNSARPDWQTPRENPSFQDSPWSERTRTSAWRAVWFRTQTQLCAAVGPPCMTSIQEFDERNWQAQFFWLWPRPSIPHGSMASFTKSWSLTFPNTSSKLYPHIWRDGRSMRPSKQPHPLVVACGLV
jgi:hypothetical protein